MADQLTVHVLVHGNNDKLAVSVAADATTCVPGASAAPPPARPTARPPAFVRWVLATPLAAMLRLKF